MLFSSTAFAILGFASYANAHMVMSVPVPFGKSTLTNSPLNGDGSDFPCKQRSGVYSAEGANNVIALGSSQPLSFTGSAVHGGGSCQISITYDLQPTKNSVWKTIYSIEGGCPMKGVTGNNGNDANAVDPSTYTFSVPNDLPTGSAVLAWTWFNKIGNREMYMNCAPITLTGGSSKRNEDEELVARNETQLVLRDQSAYNALPDMFQANIGNGCGTVDSTDLLFPNRGNSFEQDGLQTSTALSKPTGNCQSAGAAAVTVAPVATAAPSASLPGGVFATSQPIVVSAFKPSSSAAAAAATVATVAAPSASPSAAPVSPSSVGGGSAMVAGTSCTPEGTWNCMGTSFQRCASGTWSVVQAMAAGTKCNIGMGMSMAISSSSKRSVRFSHEHIRRHVKKSS